MFLCMPLVHLMQNTCFQLGGKKNIYFFKNQRKTSAKFSGGLKIQKKTLKTYSCFPNVGFGKFVFHLQFISTASEYGFIFC